MAPTFTHFFKSFYYSNSYPPSIDLSEESLSKYLLEKNPLASENVQRLISIPEVQQILSIPVTYDKNTVRIIRFQGSI
ncbi:hypothetical protein PHSC3_000193 [Chlamydiales bacterium STE3]|nr:hypothetical protein PHSC3_000193 [Chlamydiales bacterium STE3]